MDEPLDLTPLEARLLRERDEALAEVKRLRAQVAEFDAMAGRYVAAADALPWSDHGTAHLYRMHAESIRMILDGFTRSTV